MLVCQTVRIRGSSDLMDWLVSLSIKSKRSIVRQRLITNGFVTWGLNPKIRLEILNWMWILVLHLSHSEKASQLEQLGFEYYDRESNRPFTLIGASTWPGEETLLLKAQKYCIDSGIPCQLIIVPRHVERRGEIQKLLNEQSLPWASASGDFGNRFDK